MKVVVTVLLLAGFVWSCALAEILSPGLQQVVTSSLDTNGFVASAHSKDSTRPQGIRVARDLPSLAVEHGLVSVVQDWSLVCVQLCGAGLGGDPCTPYCTSVTVPVSVQNSNAEILLSPNKDLICEDLCALKLGGNVCECSSFASAHSVQDRNQVCLTFCLNNMETLAGCSLCSAVQPVKQLTAMEGEPVENAKADLTMNSNDVIAAESLSPATNPPPTPDWDALCVSLCKTGDGGSLCNCDLSPFF